MRKGVFNVLYLILYVVMLGYDVSYLSSVRDPQWIVNLECIFHGSAAVCILFYLFYIRPRFLILLFKIIPITLIIFDIFSWYYDFIITQHSDFSILVMCLATITIIMFLIPSWYICYQFGYLNEITDPSENTPLGKSLMKCKVWLVSSDGSEITNKSNTTSLKKRSFSRQNQGLILLGVIWACLAALQTSGGLAIHMFVIKFIFPVYALVLYSICKKRGILLDPTADHSNTPRWIIICQKFFYIMAGYLIAFFVGMATMLVKLSNN